MNSETIHIPDGIRFGCSGCGNCCHAWPVPLTQGDHDGIESLNFENLNICSSRQSLFCRLNTTDARLRSFTHTLEKGPDGRCNFLSADNRCQLHAVFGEAAKPSMCRLFPYTFSQAPDGVFASVSFASTAVLLNTGPLLSEQEQLLEQKWQLFKTMFTDISPDWSRLQLADGCPVSFDDYLLLESRFLKDFKDAPGTAGSLLVSASRTIARALPHAVNPERTPALESRPRIVDQLLLRHLDKFYFPDDVFAATERDFDARALMTDIVKAPDVVYFGDGAAALRFQKFAGAESGWLTDEIEDLLRRFVYCRLFARLYFGPNLANLSLLCGIHHLLFLVVLLKLKFKQHILQEGSINFLKAAEYVRTAERRLTHMSLSGQSQSVWEVLLLSRARAERLRELA